MFWRKNTQPVGLRRRVTYAFVLMIACMSVISALAVKTCFEYVEETLTDAYMSDISAALLRVLEEGDEIQLPETMEFYGNVNGLPPIPERYRDLPKGFTEITDFPAVFAYRDEWRGQPLILVRDQENFENTERTMWLAVILSAAVAVVLSALLGAVLSRRIMGPVEKLSEAVRNAANGTSYRAIPREIMTNDEVGALAKICDVSMGRLYEALRREKNFTGDVSHELRTPLTVIETSSELLEISNLTPQQSRQVSRILKAVNEMRGSVALFLKLARGDRGIGTTDSDTVHGLFAVMEEHWQTIAAARKVHLQFEVKATCPGTYSPVLLATVINNLLRNAVMSVPENGHVAVIETVDGFIVADDGSGLSAAQQESVQQPDRSVSSSSEDRDENGFAVNRKICERTGWKIQQLQGGDVGKELDWAVGTILKVILVVPYPGKRDTLCS